MPVRATVATEHDDHTGDHCPTLNDLAEEPFIWHDACSCCVLYGTLLVMALFTDLGNLKNHLISDGQAVPDDEASKINTPCDHIFSKHPMLKTG